MQSESCPSADEVLNLACPCNEVAPEAHQAVSPAAQHCVSPTLSQHCSGDFPVENEMIASRDHQSELSFSSPGLRAQLEFPLQAFEVVSGSSLRPRRGSLRLRVMKKPKVVAHEMRHNTRFWRRCDKCHCDA